jgi:hypothetical protein
MNIGQKTVERLSNDEVRGLQNVRHTTNRQKKFKQLYNYVLHFLEVVIFKERRTSILDHIFLFFWLQRGRKVFIFELVAEHYLDPNDRLSVWGVIQLTVFFNDNKFKYGISEQYLLNKKTV